jgi:hypothetical protein
MMAGGRLGSWKSARQEGLSVRNCSVYLPCIGSAAHPRVSHGNRRTSNSASAAPPELRHSGNRRSSCGPRRIALWCMRPHAVKTMGGRSRFELAGIRDLVQHRVGEEVTYCDWREETRSGACTAPVSLTTQRCKTDKTVPNNLHAFVPQRDGVK